MLTVFCMSLACFTTKKQNPICFIDQISVCKQNTLGRTYFPGTREETEVIKIHLKHNKTI